MHSEAARQWIEREDEIAREGRIARLEWLATNYPSNDAGFMLHGGWLSHQLLEEAKYLICLRSIPGNRDFGHCLH
jgi:hypothetical protein